MKLGPTGKFPQGKVDETDDGELTVAVATDHEAQIVRVIFGKRTSWLGLPREQAIAFGELIIQRAKELGS